jgi:hypothetical protein
LLGLPEEDGEQFIGRFPVIQRCDERLAQTDGAVIGPRVSPGLQLMGLRNVPVTVR